MVQKLVNMEAAELRSRRDRDRLKGNDKTENPPTPRRWGSGRVKLLVTKALLTFDSLTSYKSSNLQISNI